MYIYVNGEIVKQEEARISPLDHGYMYGLGLFETFRIYDGHPFLLGDHLLRLEASLKDLRIRMPFTRQELEEIIKTLLHVNNLNDAYIRLNVSAGIGEVGLHTKGYNQPTTIMYIKPITVQKALPKEGVILSTPRNSPEGNVRVKSHHYMNNILGKYEIGDDISKEGIFLTKEGYLSEGITSNLFFIKGDIAYTPSLETGILNGITRQFVMNVLEKTGFDVYEGLYKVDDLKDCDEIFITNSIQEIVPLIRVNGYQTDNKMTVTKKLQDIYSMYTKVLWSRNELPERIV
ncbi:aminodeoxychorismate lyase [Bacillus timonensis]|nr:aminodeoxychorismate lyase [Bacillus timonensis]